MSQAYKFVEFGRLAGGVFHDLISPLTALSLTIENMTTSHLAKSVELSVIADDLLNAQRTTLHIQKLMDSTRRYLSHEQECVDFSITNMLEEICLSMRAYAYQNSVQLILVAPQQVSLYGDPMACLQALTNIISNAIQAYSKDALSSDRERTVRITLEHEDKRTLIMISDQGSGMTPEVLAQIFEPFFSTKEKTGGLGIGLSLAKRNIEKSFGGTLSVESKHGLGSLFSAYFPDRES